MESSGISDHNSENDLLEPWRYIRQNPGKNFRGKMIEAFQYWLKIDDSKMKSVAEIVGSLHDASLLIDDIEDNSELRRGVPVAHAIYGVPFTINCANYVYFIALKQCLDLGNSEAMNVYINECLCLHRGQGNDIKWRENCSCPTEDEYIQMVIEKTGGLFRLSVGLMQAFSSNKTDFVPLVNHIAVYFQIRDDYMNLSSKEYTENKSFCEDLTEGKFSFPVIHAIRTRPDDHRLLNILKQRTKSIDVKKHAVKYLEETGSMEYTKEHINGLYKEIVREIETLGGNTMLRAIMTKLHENIP